MSPNKIALCVITAAAYLSVGSKANAAYTVTFEQVGSDVVATGGGTIDLAGLTFSTSGGSTAAVGPAIGLVSTGPTAEIPADIYSGFVGPSSFGPTPEPVFPFATASSGSGGIVGVASQQDDLFVPAGYTSGSSLSDTSTWSDTTIGGLGLTPGTYTWTWGSGLTADSFTLNIDAAPVPEPASIAILGIPAALTLFRRRRVRV
jgi:hypothetical protein